MARIILINVYFSPISFGGATIVCEETARHLQRSGWDVLIITSNSFCFPYKKYRYCIDGVDVVSIGLPENLTYEESYRNRNFADAVAEEITLFKPDIAHVHSVQGIGATVIDTLKNNQIPVVLTIHDCWWFCEKQFMINSNGKFCNNMGESAQCLYCVIDFNTSEIRRKTLKDFAVKVDRIFYPSDYFKSLHKSWEFPDKIAFVNRNGVVFPTKNYQKRSNGQLTFGFTGGPGPAKGADLILKAFQSIPDDSYELVVVDAAINVGKSWSDFENWKIPGKLTIQSSYTKETMDDFFSKIDVLLFPSQCIESFGLTVREALCRDIWVISTDQGGVVEDSHDGVNSTFIPMVDNHIPLKTAILESISSKKKLRKHVNKEKYKIRSFEEQTLELIRHYQVLLALPIHFGRPENHFK